VRSFLVDADELGAISERSLRLNDEHDLRLYAARSKVLYGHAIARRGDPVAGSALIRQGLADCAAVEAMVFTCYFRALLAEAYLLQDDADEAQRILAATLDQSERIGEHWYLAELHRRIGDVHRQAGNDQQAAACFEQALAIARSQGAKLWELNAATS